MRGRRRSSVCGERPGWVGAAPGLPSRRTGSDRTPARYEDRYTELLEPPKSAAYRVRRCIALPVCMGGCAHHAIKATLYENDASCTWLATTLEPSHHAPRERVLALSAYAVLIAFSGASRRQRNTRRSLGAWRMQSATN